MPGGVRRHIGPSQGTSLQSLGGIFNGSAMVRAKELEAQLSLATGLVESSFKDP